MAYNDYQFATTWQLAGTVGEITDVLLDVPSLTRWCPAVYRKARIVAAGNERRIGTVIELIAGSRTGYALRFWVQITEMSEDRCEFTVSGDLAGAGSWQLIPRHTDLNMAETDMVTHWHVRVEKPLLKYASALLRPLFVSNHNWAMAQSMRCLNQELARHR